MRKFSIGPELEPGYHGIHASELIWILYEQQEIFLSFKSQSRIFLLKYLYVNNCAANMEHQQNP